MKENTRYPISFGYFPEDTYSSNTIEECQDHYRVDFKDEDNNTLAVKYYQKSIIPREIFDLLKKGVELSANVQKLEEELKLTKAKLKLEKHKLEELKMKTKKEYKDGDIKFEDVRPESWYKTKENMINLLVETVEKFRNKAVEENLFYTGVEVKLLPPDLPFYEGTKVKCPNKIVITVS